jgi:hypothetical protein
VLFADFFKLFQYEFVCSGTIGNGGALNWLELM